VPERSFSWPFQAGIRLVPYLVKLIAEQHVTILQLVPSLLQMLLQGWVCGLFQSATRLLRRRGAVCRAAATLFSRLEAELYNLYGPTEAAIDVTCGHASERVIDGRSPSVVPLPNTQIYLLDSHLQPVPIGVPGELCIGGIGLARGYLYRPS